MNALLDWIDDRTGFVAAYRKCAGATIPGGVRWRPVWLSMILFTLIVQMLTGFFLWMYYSPSAQTAWESVYYLQYHVAGGWLLRSVHHYTAQVMVGLSGLYVIGLVFSGAYRPPREFVFWTAMATGLCVLGACLTGDLLAWDQNSYAATMVRTKFLMLLPVLGDDFFRLAAGGPAFGHLTLTRFFALHVGLFAPALLVLVVLLLRFAARAARSEAGADESAGLYWPDQAVRNMLGCLAVMVVVGLLIGWHGFSGDHAGQAPGDYLGVGLGAPADPDPANFYAAARPEWSFRGLYQLSNMFEGSQKLIPIFIIPALLVLALAAMPILGRFHLGHLVSIVVMLVLVVGMGYLTFASYRHDRQSEPYGAAVAEGKQHAARVKELAASPTGIPATGALTLLREDPKTQGPVLFGQHCASCHEYAGGDGPQITAQEPSAPNLYGFARAAWFTGFFDPKQIAGPKYFGNTAFKDGTMADFVGGNLKELRDEIGEEDFQKLVTALADGAKLDAARSDDQIDGDIQFLFEDFTCIDCHKVHDSGALGSGPDLTGYGSRAWLVGIISDPTHKRFYGSDNDRMPAYAEDPDDPNSNILTGRQIEMLADWLRGKWYEPGQAAE